MLKKLLFLPIALLLAVPALAANPSFLSTQPLLALEKLSDAPSSATKEEPLLDQPIDFTGATKPLSPFEFRNALNSTVRKSIESAKLLQKAKIVHRANETRLAEARESLDKARGKEEISASLAHMQTRSSWAETSKAQVSLLEGQLERLTHDQNLYQQLLPYLSGRNDYGSLIDWKKYLTNRLHLVNREHRDLETKMVDLAAEIGEQELRLNEPGLSNENKKAAKSKLNALQRRKKYQEEAAAILVANENISKRFLYQLQQDLGHLTPRQHLQRVLYSLKTVWRFELLKVDDNSISIGKVIIAFFILCLGIFISKYATRFFGFLVIKKMHADPGASLIFQRIFLYLFLLGTITFALHVVSIPLTMFAFLGGAFVLAIGFGAQNLLNNFISGVIIMMERPIKIGDLIQVDGSTGRVANIGARCSRITLPTGIDLLVPNSTLLEKTVTNYTLSDRHFRLKVAVGVAYGSPTREVEKLLKQIIEEHPKILKEPKPSVQFTAFGDNSLQFEIDFWINLSESDGGAVSSDLRFRIDELFREAKINIAFPQRDLHMDKPIEVKILSQSK